MYPLHSTAVPPYRAEGKAVVVLHEGQTATEEEISGHCRGKIAGYKVPRKVFFIKDEEMPRSGPGKLLHRVLRERYGMWKDHV